MPFSYGSWAPPVGYDTKVDLLSKFAEGRKFGRDLRDEAGAPDLVARTYDAYGKQPRTLAELSGGVRIGQGEVRPTFPRDPIQGSFDAAAGAADLDLQAALNSRYGANAASPFGSASGNPLTASNSSGSLADLGSSASPSPDMSSYFASLAGSESGGNDAAKNPNSSATGRYQFIDSTWQNLAQQHPELGLTADGRTDLEYLREWEVFLGKVRPFAFPETVWLIETLRVWTNARH